MSSTLHFRIDAWCLSKEQDGILFSRREKKIFKFLKENCKCRFSFDHISHALKRILGDVTVPRSKDC